MQPIIHQEATQESRTNGNRRQDAAISPGLSTRTLHQGAQRRHAFHSLTPPIVQTAAYTFEDTDAVIAFKSSPEKARLEYGRYGNPTVQGVERRMAALEGGEAALLVSSGMAAITLPLLLLLSSGDHLIVGDDTYHRTRVFANDFLVRYGVSVSTVPTTDLDAIEAAIRPNTRVIVAETPTNPFLRCVDLAGLADIGRAHGVITLIDSTFATPLNQQPLQYGVDLVVHSVTKYLAGHNDLLAGVVVGRSELIEALRDSQGLFGAVVDPSTAYQIHRGLQTLGLRIAQQNRSALTIARYLDSHPKVRRVWYPGLASHPDHEVARRQMTGFGGVVSFEIEGDGAAASRFVDALELAHIAPSLGGVDTLVMQPAILSYFNTPREQRLALGITDELIRLAVGIEDEQDLLADIAQALEAV
ncbi:MAG TPA: aminotransferase class I/II-fold pyridoxal phosphate-dependent enzyme [Anaerolineae bacterium]|nr:aminotransferase class I/II-fold pyridoxal phosphate-dependent enzyme [Caldilineae bacterium]HID35506.1 aminotransferase class I/II-fold pyridoxal phosphate-dependent enzyme [Anaerolineae bacterium]